MKKVHIFLLVALFFTPFVGVSAYDIRNDFCGVHINFQYCKCAFHGQYCSAIGMDQSSADTYVNTQFNLWVSQQDCLVGGGLWDDDTCQYADESDGLSEESIDNEESVEDDTDDLKQDEEENNDEKKTEEELCLDKKYHKYNNQTKECKCEQLYKSTQDGQECYFNGDDGLSLNVEDAINFQDELEVLEPGQGMVYTGTDLEGESVKIGVIRKPDGTYVFTTNGKNYFGTANEAVNPNLISRIKTGWSNMWRTVGQWFGVNKYTGKDTAGDSEKQKEGQAKLDASILAWDDLRALDSDPEKQLAQAKSLQKLWSGRSKDLLGENYENLLLNELKNASGYDVKKIKQVLEGDYEGLAQGQINSIKSSLYSFPADAVETLATELRKNDFATGASLYMSAREEGKDPSQIYADLISGQFPELEYKQLTGVSLQYAQASMVLAYEDAYQRYLIDKQLN